MNHIHYFVDESGDGVLFNAKGRVLLDQSGAVRYFMLGLLQVADPLALSRDMDALRAELLADSYFNGVPSMQTTHRKTALIFHAKDDLPEVRREVFKLLAKHDFKFFAVVRDMHSVLSYVQERNAREPHYRYKPDEIYDNAVGRLFKDRLHQNASCQIYFAKRGRTDRTQAFRSALSIAKARFERKWNTSLESGVLVNVTTPQEHAGLQAVDYMLWALQRQYATGESSYLDSMWYKVSLIYAVDETETSPDGVYYTKKNPPKKKPPTHEVAL